MTTNSGEDGWSTGYVDGNTSRFRQSISTGHLAPDSLVSSGTDSAGKQNTYTYTWDLTQYTDGNSPISQWDDRIITALEFNIAEISDDDDDAATEATIADGAIKAAARSK